MSCYNILHFSLFWEGIFEICLFAKGKHLNNQKFTLSSLATGGNAPLIFCTDSHLVPFDIALRELHSYTF